MKHTRKLRFLIICMIVLCFTGCSAKGTEATETETGSGIETSESEGSQVTETEIIQNRSFEWKIVCSDATNFYETSAASTQIGVVPNGAIVKLVGWGGKYAQVDYNGTVGYVYSTALAPASDAYLEEHLKTVTLTEMYTYEQMMADINTLQSQFPELVTKEIIGTSELGREIPALRIGKETATYHILFQGAIHGREHMTPCILMAMCDYWLNHNIASLGDICFHVIPMVNPDGVIISQSETLGNVQKNIYALDQQLGHTTNSESVYARRWKANALGVDLNRNFPVGWVELDDRTTVSSSHYKGTEPFSAKEASVLRDYTLRYDFDATISYHSTGSIIYYKYMNEAINDLCEDLAQSVKTVTGYDLVGGDAADSGGFRDWAAVTLGIPSITVEVGCNLAPLTTDEAYAIFERNYRVFAQVAEWVQKN